MAKPLIDLAALSRAEQFDLLDRLWDTVGRDVHALPLSEEQPRELNVRLDELERDVSRRSKPEGAWAGSNHEV